MSSELQWVTDRPITDLLRYRAESHTDVPARPAPAAPPLLPEYLDLPPGFNPRTLELARELRRDPAAGRAPARPAWSRRRWSGCAPAATATRWTPASTAQHTADEFWFDRGKVFANTSRRPSWC